MDILVLLLGAIAVANPFIGMILTMIYLSFRLRKGASAPLRMLALFFVLPISLMLWAASKDPGVFLAASDAVWGVGLCLLLFMFSLHHGSKTSTALANGSVLIIVYGMLRYLIFGKYLTMANNQAVSDLTQAFPQLLSIPDMQKSLATMHYLIASSWIVPQLVALFIGFIVFQHLAGIRFAWREFYIPRYYNMLIIAALPLYLYPQLHTVLINSLIALCVLPFIQGIGVLVHYSSSHTSNMFIMILLTILIILNLILVALLGFTDIWFDFRKLYSKGKLA